MDYTKFGNRTFIDFTGSIRNSLGRLVEHWKPDCTHSRAVPRQDGNYECVFCHVLITPPSCNPCQYYYDINAEQYLCMYCSGPAPDGYTPDD